MGEILKEGDAKSTTAFEERRERAAEKAKKELSESSEDKHGHMKRVLKLQC